MNKIFFNLILLFFLLMSTMALGQKDIADQSYNLDFLEAKYNENKGEKEILLIFKYEPKKKKKFKPILSTKITYSIGDDEIEKNEYMMMSKHSIVFYGNDIDEKSPEVYSLIRDKINLSQKQKFGIVVFHLRDIVNEYTEQMTFTYGLWEPENEKIRIEKKYTISISR